MNDLKGLAYGKLVDIQLGVDGKTDSRHQFIIGKFPERGIGEIVDNYNGRYYIVSLGERKMATFGLPHVFETDIEFAIGNAYDCFRIAKWLESIGNMDIFIQDENSEISFSISVEQRDEFRRSLSEE